MGNPTMWFEVGGFYIQVDDIEAPLGKVEALGGKRAMGRWTSPTAAR